MPEDPAARIRRAMARKSDPLGYWRTRGIRRFVRELAADGYSPEQIVEVLDPVIDEVVASAIASAGRVIVPSEASRRPGEHPPSPRTSGSI